MIVDLPSYNKTTTKKLQVKLLYYCAITKLFTKFRISQIALRNITSCQRCPVTSGEAIYVPLFDYRFDIYVYSVLYLNITCFINGYMFITMTFLYMTEINIMISQSSFSQFYWVEKSLGKSFSQLPFWSGKIPVCKCAMHTCCLTALFWSYSVLLRICRSLYHVLLQYFTPILHIHPVLLGF